jgi:hypothetical protein
MGRLALHLAAVAALLALFCATPAWVRAQQAPTDHDLTIYAGLHAAAAKGDVAEIERLIAAGEKPDLQDANSRTPLIVAAFRKQYEAMRALIRLGANPNARDAEHYDVLTIAAVQNDLAMLKLALEGGASAKNITAPYDGTALMAAAHLGHIEAVRALIAAQAPLDHVNSMGWTALIEAVLLGNGDKAHGDTVEALVKAGANVDIKDRRGMTAIDYARQRGYSDMVRVMEPASGRRT